MTRHPPRTIRVTKQGPTVHTVVLYPPNTTIAHILLNYPHGAPAFLTVEGNQDAVIRRERPITFLLSGATCAALRVASGRHLPGTTDAREAP